jgi:hypothetical protein
MDCCPSNRRDSKDTRSCLETIRNLNAKAEWRRPGSYTPFPVSNRFFFIFIFKFLIILFRIFDWNKSGKEDLIGEFKASLRELLTGAQSGKDFEIIHPEMKKKKRGYKNSGNIKFVRCEIAEIYSFLDYLKGGCNISLMVGIDFTASNGYVLDLPSFPFLPCFLPLSSFLIHFP